MAAAADTRSSPHCKGDDGNCICEITNDRENFFETKENDKGKKRRFCTECDHQLLFHPAGPTLAPTSSTSTAAGWTIAVRLWDIHTDHPVEALVSGVRTYSDLQAQIFSSYSHLSAIDPSLLQLYYLVDPISAGSRRYVNNDVDLIQYINQRPTLPQVCTSLIVYIRPSSTRASPDRLPLHLRIDTKAANKSDAERKMEKGKLSPTSSPKDIEGRSMHVKQQCILRDGVTTGDGISMEIRCRFCAKQQTVIYENNQPSSPRYNGEVAHIVSFKERDREGLEVPECLRLFANGIGGKDGVDVIQNVIYLCKDCHKLFGKGLVWCEIQRSSPIAPSSSDVLRLYVEDLALKDEHGRNLSAHHQHVDIPQNAPKRSIFPFDPPYDALWQWNQRWAEKRRKSGVSSTLSTSSVAALKKSDIAAPASLVNPMQSLRLSDSEEPKKKRKKCHACKKRNSDLDCTNEKGLLCSRCCKADVKLCSFHKR